MPLQSLPVHFDDRPFPAQVSALLFEAERRIEQFQRECRVPGFVPSDYRQAYRLLRWLAEAEVPPGTVFCEWGSGFGVVACLAAQLEFNACGIEIDSELVSAARKLAGDFELPVEFARGSFIPAKALPKTADFAWLGTDSRDGYQALGLDLDELDLVYAYPWPDEEELTRSLFERHAAVGAVLVTHHDTEKFSVWRKIARGSRR